MSWKPSVDPDTLAISHIFDGEEVVTGMEDGRVCAVATFIEAKDAELFVATYRWVAAMQAIDSLTGGGK